jgi:hypothetical protein
VAYGILNAVLYASLTPLWEGFDEPFHYGYVQTLSQQRTLPQLGRTALAPELWASLQIAPASHVVKRNLPWVMTFQEYVKHPLAERWQLRNQLEHLPRTGDARGANYEAHQAPLAYLILAPLDRAWASAGLLTRIWRLRMVCGISSVILTAVFLFLLARRLGLSRPFEGRLVFTVLSLQTLYATTAHIANDWLAVPLMLILFERLLAFRDHPGLRTALLLTLALDAALLTKAYFLAMLPLVFGTLAGFALARRIHWRVPLASAAVFLMGCGPWYIRNLHLYSNLTGMQETAGGTRWQALISAAAELPWQRALKQMAFTSLWTGNNSFTSFSTTTLSMLWIGFAAAAILTAFLFVRGRSVPLPQGLLLAGCGLHAAALLYSCVLSFWFSQGAAMTASPWYILPIIPVVLLTVFSGLDKFRRLGAAVSLWLVWWSAYIIAVSYWGKLIPMYAGYAGERANILPLLAWYRQSSAAVLDALSTAAMTDARLLFGLLAAVTLAALALAIALSTPRWSGRPALRAPRPVPAGTSSAVPEPGSRP